MKTNKILATVVALSLCTGAAMARGGVPKNNTNNPKPPPDKFKELDTNHDGKLSKEEFLAGKGGSAEEFAKLDKNGDGFLDHYEFSKAKKKN